MENVVLVIHLFLAVALIGVVLLQRSEGGGLGMGGGSGDGMMSSRGVASALSKVTWILAIAFICTSIALTLINAAGSSGGSVLDQLAPEAAGEATGADILPPSLNDGGPLLPVAE
ncbi:MAG: preprotein translocase subunit SecG [Planktomarina sp.]